MEEGENRLAKNPTLADVIFLTSVDEFLSQVVGQGDFLPQIAARAQKKRRGRPTFWDDDRLYLLEILVEEGKRRWHCKKDVEVLRRVVERTWGLKRKEAKARVRVMQKMLSEARKKNNRSENSVDI